MRELFMGLNDFNEDLSRWDTGSSTDMGGMFWEASSFNSDLSGWNVAAVTDMGFMFSEASSFKSELQHWNTSNVKTMQCMFSNASSFNSDLSAWHMPGNTRYIFYGATSMEKPHWPRGIEKAVALEKRDLKTANQQEGSNAAEKLETDDILQHQKAALSSGQLPFNRSRVMVVGQGRVGKTTLLRRLLGKPFNPNEQSTVGAVQQDIDAKVSKLYTIYIQLSSSFCKATNPSLLPSSRFVSLIAGCPRAGGRGNFPS